MSVLQLFSFNYSSISLSNELSLGWHTSKDLQIPQGLPLTFLPPYSPELQPAERLWTLVDEPIVNQSFQTLDDLEEVLFHRCQSLLQQQDLIQGLTGFHWWTKIAA